MGAVVILCGVGVSSIIWRWLGLTGASEGIRLVL